ncbi:RNA 2',3'-cyclic phosphodiesterase [Candidatus Bipolaricaulota bacterium]|nr:RNA 2',3'-cyclic phosphodiesterase [Candidatus Bipolaricaulota bacterium]
MRAFFCIVLQEEIRRLLGGIAGELRRSTNVRASWVSADNYHVTLQFLGEIDAMLAVDLQRKAEAAIGDQAAFDVLLDRVSGFPTADRPRVVWAGGSARGSFADLVRLISDAIVPLGFPRERESDVFHITLARLKGAADRELVRAISEASDRVAPIPVRVAGVTLMESRLTQRGVRYCPLFEIPLTG